MIIKIRVSRFLRIGVLSPMDIYKHLYLKEAYLTGLLVKLYHMPVLPDDLGLAIKVHTLIDEYGKEPDSARHRTSSPYSIFFCHLPLVTLSHLISAGSIGLTACYTGQPEQ